MAIGVILGIVFAVLLIGTIIGAVICFYNKHAVGGALCSVGILAMFLCFLCIPFSFHTVQAGQVAVVRHLGKIESVKTAGTYFDFWMTKKYIKYDAKVQNIDINTSAYSKDAQTMDITMTVQFQIQQDKAKDIAIQYGDLGALENKIQNVVIERTKSVLSKYSAMEIIEKRAEISPEVEQFVKGSIDDSYFVNITTVVLSNIDFSDVFEQTVEDKMIAEQEKLKAQYEKEKAIIEAEKELEVAKLRAQARIAEAEGDAEAQKVAAAAEAYAIQIKIIELARSLGYTVTEEEVGDGIQYKIEWGDDDDGQQMIIEYLKYLEYLSKWNGELPDVVAGDSLSILIPSTPAAP